MESDDPQDVELSTLFAELAMDSRSIRDAVSEELQLVTLELVLFFLRRISVVGTFRLDGFLAGPSPPTCSLVVSVGSVSGESMKLGNWLVMAMKVSLPEIRHQNKAPFR